MYNCALGVNTAKTNPSDIRTGLVEVTEIRECLRQRCAELAERVGRIPLFDPTLPVRRTLRMWPHTALTSVPARGRTAKAQSHE